MSDPYIAEVKYLGTATKDFVEIAVDEAADVSGMTVTIYNGDGSVRTENALGDIANSLSGKDIYVVNADSAPGFDGLNKAGGVALDNNGHVFEFVSFTDTAAAITAIAGAAIGQTSVDIGQAGMGRAQESQSSQNYFVQETPSEGFIAPCFMTGSLILTPSGERPIEGLRAGDMVITRDRGPQKLRWVGHKEMPANPGATGLPVRIAAHAFGRGVPTRALWVSPYHRLVIDHPNCEILFASREVLVAAKYAQNRQNVRQADPGRRFAYHHLLFDQHEIVYSNGMATESFHPVQDGLDAFAGEARTEVLALFPELASTASALGQTARPVLRPFEAALINAA